MDVGESEIAAGVSVGELQVVEPEQVQDGGVQVVDVDLVLSGVVAELIGRPISDSRLGSSAGQPHGESIGVVVTAV